ncbi:MAG: O-antigen ligase family protein [Ktedonobacterales bacterium]
MSRVVRVHLHFPWWGTWSENHPASFRMPDTLKRPIAGIAAAFAAAVAGIASTFVSPNVAARVTLGVPIIVFLARYRYVLLLLWALSDTFIGSVVPFFNGQNLDTALTVPLLIAMVILPVRRCFRRMPALAVLLAFLAWVLAGIRLSPLDLVSFLKSWTLELNYVAIAVLTICTVTTRRRLLVLIDCILVLFTVLAVYGIYSYVTHTNGGYDPTTGQFRIFIIYLDSAPSAALSLLLALPLALYRAITLRGPMRVTVWCAVALLVIGIVLTFSRLALISIALIIIIMAPFLPSRKMLFSLLGGVMGLSILVGILAAVNNTSIFARFFNTDVATLNGRTVLWVALIKDFDPTHLLGNGMDAAHMFLVSAHLEGIADVPSNLFVTALYDYGIIGVTLLGAVFVTLLINLMKGARNATGEHRVLYAVAVAVTLSVLIESLELDDFQAQSIGIYFWILSALPFADYWFQSRWQTRSSGREVAGEADKVVDAEETQAAGRRT